LRIDGGFSAGFSCTTPHDTTWIMTMTPKAVEHLLTQDARLLARRDAPVIDQELESQRQAALDLFFQWQDGMREFQDLLPFCVVLQRKVDLNQDLLRWERKNID
jgi:hypothetical protein